MALLAQFMAVIMFYNTDPREQGLNFRPESIYFIEYWVQLRPLLAPKDCWLQD